MSFARAAGSRSWRRALGLSVAERLAPATSRPASTMGCPPSRAVGSVEGSRGSIGCCARSPPSVRSYATYAMSCGNGDFGRLGHGGFGEGEAGLGLSAETFRRVTGVPKGSSASHASSVSSAAADPRAQGVNVTAVSAGGSHTALVGSDGVVYTCGLNDHGQLGHSPHSLYVPAATPVEGLPPYDPVVAVSAGHYHTLCVTASGELWAFGRNDQSQCGLGKDAPPKVHAPAWVETLSPHRAGSAGGVKGVAAGNGHSLAVTSEGAVYSWGASSEGVLGHGAEERWRWGFFARSAVESVPRLVRALADHGTRGEKVSVGLMHSACVDTAGRVYVWGQNRFNQLGLGGTSSAPYVTEPTAIPGLGRTGEIACGGNFTVAASLQGGALSAWGVDNNGELGRGGQPRGGPAGVPRAVMRAHAGDGGAGRFVKIGAGWKHAAGVTAQGLLYTWGWGGSAGTHYDAAFSSGGQLGLNHDGDMWEPAMVEGIGTGSGSRGDKRRAIDISCGYNHTVVLVEEP